MKTYLGKACQAFPQALPMAADLSATMGADRSADLAFALEMINCVLEQAGDQPLYRLNRGIVLLHSSRARDALADMQFAVDHLENKSPAYRAIAEAYMALGMKNLAQEQLRLSAEAAKAEASQASKPTNDGGTGEKPANKK